MSKKRFEEILLAIAVGAGLGLDADEYWFMGEAVERFLRGVATFFGVEKPQEKLPWRYWNIGEYETFESATAFLWEHKSELGL